MCTERAWVSGALSFPSLLARCLPELAQPPGHGVRRRGPFPQTRQRTPRPPRQHHVCASRFPRVVAGPPCSAWPPPPRAACHPECLCPCGRGTSSSVCVCGLALSENVPYVSARTFSRSCHSEFWPFFTPIMETPVGATVLPTVPRGLQRTPLLAPPGLAFVPRRHFCPLGMAPQRELPGALFRWLLPACGVSEPRPRCVDQGQLFDGRTVPHLVFHT